MNRPVPISVFSDQHRTKSTTRSRTSCGTHTLVRAPQDFFLRRCARPSIRPAPRPWSESFFPEIRFVVVRLGGPAGSCPERPPHRSQRILFANGRTPLAAAHIPRTDRKPALYPASAALGWQPSLPQCSAFALSACALSVILTEERSLHFQLRQDSLRGDSFVAMVQAPDLENDCSRPRPGRLNGQLKSTTSTQTQFLVGTAFGDEASLVRSESSATHKEHRCGVAPTAPSSKSPAIRHE